VAAHRRNQTSPAAAIVLRDDAELRAGAVDSPEVDLTLWGNLADRVACVDQHALFARVDGQLVTPPLADGAPRTAWRHALLTGPGAVEAPLALPGLVATVDALALLSPWGEPAPVASLAGEPVDAAASAALVDELRERSEDLRR
jgi:branched-chain amino acid aminotransferase